jgi:hypothetical protein
MVKMTSGNTHMGEQEMTILQLADDVAALQFDKDNAWLEYNSTGDRSILNEKLARIEDNERDLKNRYRQLSIFRGSSEFTELVNSSLEQKYKQQAAELVMSVQDLRSSIEVLQSLGHILNKVYEEGLVNYEQYVARKDELERRLRQQNSASDRIINILTSDYKIS